MDQERSPLKEFEIRGEWWLPHSPTNRVTGVLRYAVGEWVRLELDGSLKNHWVADGHGCERYSFDGIPIPMTVGTGTDGSACTLLEGVDFGGLVLGRSLLIGRHPLHGAEPLFESAEVRVSDLEGWSQHSPFGFPLSPLNGPNPYNVGVTYRSKQLLGFDIPSRECRLELWSGTAPSLSVYKSLTVEHVVLLLVRPSVPQSLPWFQRFFVDLGRIFSFFVGRRVYRIKTELFQPSVGGTSESGREVELYEYRAKPNLREELRPEQMPLPFRYVQPAAPQAFEAWFSSAQGLAHVQQLLLEALPPEDAGLESAMLRLAQAVEVYYRCAVGETYVKAEEYEGYCQSMLGSLPENAPGSLRERLRKYLKYGNDRSLRSAVKCLIKKLRASSQTALRIGDANKFAASVANTRNAMTHRTKQEGPVASTAGEYLELNRTLRALLYGALAEQLGFEESAVAQCVGKVRAGV